MAEIKGATFEDGSLTHATTGLDTAVGTVTLDNTSKLKGVYSAFVDAVSSLLREDFTAVDTCYVSTYAHYTAFPSSSNKNALCIKNGATNLCRIHVTNAGVVQLRDGGGTTVASGPTLSLNTTYRFGLEYQKGTGSNAILRAYVATGDDAFGAAFGETTSGTATSQATRVEVGNIESTIPPSWYFDNVRIRDDSMPGPDGGGGGGTPDSPPPRLFVPQLAIYRM